MRFSRFLVSIYPRAPSPLLINSSIRFPFTMLATSDEVLLPSSLCCAMAVVHGITHIGAQRPHRKKHDDHKNQDLAVKRGNPVGFAFYFLQFAVRQVLRLFPFIFLQRVRPAVF